MLESPTARQLAEEFIAEGQSVKVSFEAMADTSIVEINGKIPAWKPGTTSAVSGQSPVVSERGLPSADLGSAANAPVTLAHELFGHALTTSGRQAGRPNSYYAYRNNETNAGVVG